MKITTSLLMLAYVLCFRPTEALADYTGEQRLFYLGHLSSMINGRPLSPTEQNTALQEPNAIDIVVSSWTQSAHLESAAQDMLNRLLSTSGQNQNVNWNLPGNLIRYIVKSKLPLSEVITANYCVADNLTKTACDTKAPYQAGVLTTRAYLMANKGRFNLSRASTLLKTFACQEYPMPTTLQPPLEKTDLIEMFARDKVEAGENIEFGNGFACYKCHSQFGAHTQFFVRFDQNGIYQPNATGLQMPGAEPGVSENQLYVSHFNSATNRSSSETSNMFGAQVNNLSQAAQEMAKNPIFLECSIRNTLGYFLRLDQKIKYDIDPALIKTIASSIESENPTFQEIVNKTFTNKKVIESILDKR